MKTNTIKYLIKSDHLYYDDYNGKYYLSDKYNIFCCDSTTYETVIRTRLYGTSFRMELHKFDVSDLSDMKEIFTNKKDFITQRTLISYPFFTNKRCLDDPITFIQKQFVNKFESNSRFFTTGSNKQVVVTDKNLNIIGYISPMNYNKTHDDYMISSYRCVVGLATKELHEQFLQLAAENGLEIGLILIDEDQKRTFCHYINKEYIPMYSYITHK